RGPRGTAGIVRAYPPTPFSSWASEIQGMTGRRTEAPPDRVTDVIAALEQHEFVRRAASCEEIAQVLAIEVRLDDLPARVKGYATPIDGNWYVIVARDLSAAEREWTIAHELAHTFGIRGEELADSFAAELLFTKREAELWTSIEGIGKREDVLGGLSGLSNRLTDLWLLERHIITEEKRKKVRELAAGITLVTLVGLAGFSFFKLAEYVTEKIRRSHRGASDRYGDRRGELTDFQ